MKLIPILTLSILLLNVPDAGADFFGPSVERHALSPDGNLLVRISTPERDESPGSRRTHRVSYYGFDPASNGYVFQSSFSMTNSLSQMLYVSDSGDLIFISLRIAAAVRLYKKDGELSGSWRLNEFLTEEEIEACAKTGSTLQWFDEGSFHEHIFHLRGPSRLIRALSPSYTVIRGADPNITFSATIDTKTGKLTKRKTKEP